MIRKCVAAAAVVVVGLLGAPGAAQAGGYAAPTEPDLVLQLDPADIVAGTTQVPFESLDFLPGSDAVFSVSAPGVAGEDIALEVLESGSGSGETARRSVALIVSADGTFRVGVVFPTDATYTVVSEGLDLDGQPTSLSMELRVGAGGGDLPGTGFTSSSALLAGAGLAALGAGVILLSRRRPSPQRESVHTGV